MTVLVPGAPAHPEPQARARAEQFLGILFLAPQESVAPQGRAAQPEYSAASRSFYLSPPSGMYGMFGAREPIPDLTCPLRA